MLSLVAMKAVQNDCLVAELSKSLLRLHEQSFVRFGHLVRHLSHDNGTALCQLGVLQHLVSRALEKSNFLSPVSEQQFT